MKSFFQFILQKIFGLNTYLFLFSIFMVWKLKIDKREKDFLYFNKFIKKTGIILDIGANIGVMTTHLSKKHKNSKILSIEPLPVNFKTLKRITSFFKLKNVTLLNIALGDKEGEAEMVMPVVKSVKKQGLSHIVHDSIKEYNEGEICKVQVCKMDDLNEIRNGDPLVAIKIDVENFEYFVLKGGEKTLADDKPVIYIELWDNENRNKCFALLKNLGYLIYIVQKKQLVEYDANIHNKQNFIFIPENY